ncbi:cAMP-specific 3',5'-cyclic phosphodiesterase [Hondaea fermentalgiana]|uniref:Phosphodiesterase n=1 Tax=Hondaea fermentalgiana TaxID=2315210 RepID=A0A2R5G7U9_9STRA|nr:cAMP-specific 3',5'-cyclic phosphodiesterase [Hondaea fermentalgiana]|eukprot:GBG27136.1 cAMP-specific 3',5'-cyclic phosphodiesterase [Hondaea fermentalgiana]
MGNFTTITKHTGVYRRQHQAEVGIEMHVSRFRDLMTDSMRSIGAVMPLQETARVFIDHAKKWVDVPSETSLVGVFVHKDLADVGDDYANDFGLVCVQGDVNTFCEAGDIQHLFITEGQKLADRCLGMEEVESEVEGESGGILQMLAIPIFTYSDGERSALMSPRMTRKLSTQSGLQGMNPRISEAGSLLKVPEEESGDVLEETKSDGLVSQISSPRSERVGAVMVYCRLKHVGDEIAESRFRGNKAMLKLFLEAGSFLKQAAETEIRQTRLHRSQQMLTASMDSSYIFNNTEDVFKALAMYEDYLRDLLSAECCMVLLVDESKMQLWRKLGQSSNARMAIEDDSLLGEVVTQGTCARVYGTGRLEGVASQLFELAGLDQATQLSSLMCVPFGTDTETFGVVVALNKKPGEEVSWPQTRSKHTNLTDLISFKYLDLTYMMQASTDGDEGSSEHLQSLLSMYDPMKRKVNARGAYGSSTNPGAFRKENSMTRISVTEDGRGVHMSSHIDLNNALHSDGGDALLGEPLNPYCHQLESWDLDILSLSEDHLVGCSLAILEKFQVLDRYGVKAATAQAFVEEVRKNYLPNPYHNFAHGVSVLHGSSMMLHKGIFKLLKASDVLALLVGALCHDLGHPGTNNDFQISSGSSLAILYNDISVLENFHASKTFQILQKDACNIFAEMPGREARQEVRETIVKAILSTDISKHFKLIDDLKAKYQGAVSDQLSTKMAGENNGRRSEAGSPAAGGGPNPDLRASGRRMTSLSPMRRGTFSVASVTIKRKQAKSAAKLDVITSGKMAPITSMGHHGEEDGPRASDASEAYVAIDAADIFHRDKREDRLLLVETVIHAADLSNPVLRFDLYQGWTDLVVQEFYNQSLQEKALGLPSQPHMCSPPDDIVAKGKLQISFVDFIVGPLWAVIQDIFPQLVDRYETLESNRAAAEHAPDGTDGNEALDSTKADEAREPASGDK